MARPAASKVETIRKQIMYMSDTEIEQLEDAIAIIRECREAQAEMTAETPKTEIVK